MHVVALAITYVVLAVPPSPVTSSIWSESPDAEYVPIEYPRAISKPSAAALLTQTSTLGRYPGNLPGQLGSLLAELRIEAPVLNPLVLERALVAFWSAQDVGFGRKPILTVIDYGLPTSQRRMWVFNLAERRKIFWEYVAHGVGSGGEYAERWSNKDGSLASSLGLFVTRGTYTGRRGYSLRLIGLDPQFNDQAFRRSIVVHGAHYMTPKFQASHDGFFGQSHGCPALDEAVASEVIDYIAKGSLVFAHWPDETWLTRSAWLRGQVPQNLRARPPKLWARRARRPTEPQRPTSNLRRRTPPNPQGLQYPTTSLGPYPPPTLFISPISSELN